MLPFQLYSSNSGTVLISEIWLILLILGSMLKVVHFVSKQMTKRQKAKQQQNPKSNLTTTIWLTQ